MMQSMGKTREPMHHNWGDLENRKDSHRETSLSLDSMDDIRKKTMAAALEEAVQHSESFTSEWSADSDQDGMIDVNAVRMKIRELQNGLTQSKGSSGDAKTAASMLQTEDQDEEEDEEEEDNVGEPGGFDRLAAGNCGPVVGLKRNAASNCRPCHYVNTKAGCTNGADCTFCHLDHPKRLRPRPCKSKRTRCKQLAGMLDTVFANDPEQMNEAAEILSKQNAYLKAVVKSKVRNLMSHTEQSSTSKLSL